MRRFFVGGNWKSNGTTASVRELIESVLNPVEINFDAVEVVVAPVYIHIPLAQSLLKGEIQVSAQNCSATGQGAFTGEIAPNMIKDLGLNWTILGHSERRNIYKETDELIATKIKNAQTSELSVIACIGESLEERDAGVTIDVVTRQMNAIKDSVLDWSKIVIAYEPVWAIGTGRNATPEQAQEAHLAIRQWLQSTISPDVANATRIIYGGSVTDQNCTELIAQPDVDGFLVGGASLKPAFKTILEACHAEKSN